MNTNIGGIFMGKMIMNAKSNGFDLMPKGTFRGGEQQDTETMTKGTFRGGEQGMPGAYIPKRTGGANNVSVKRVSAPNAVKESSPTVAVKSGDKEVYKLPRVHLGRDRFNE